MNERFYCPKEEKMINNNACNCSCPFADNGCTHPYWKYHEQGFGLIRDDEE